MKAMLTLCMGLIFSAVSSFGNFQSPQKAPARIYLGYFKSLEKQQLSVRVLAKIDKRYKPKAGVKVAFYKDEISDANLLGTATTTADGTGIFTFNKKQFEAAQNAKVARYLAIIVENEMVESKKTDITIKKVNLNTRFFTEDSINMIHVHVSETDSVGNDIPQKKVKVKFLVERPLSPLPVGGDYNTTDKKGNVAIEFPDDLPGGAEGYVKIFVRIVESDDYGTVEVSEVKQWGVPTHFSDLTTQRTLWASRANVPIPLLIAILSLIVVVWGMIFYMFYEILQIRKLGEKMLHNT